MKLASLLRRLLARFEPERPSLPVIHAGREICSGCDRVRDPGFVPPKFTPEEATRRFSTGRVLGSNA